jgi:tellurite resistance protein TerC
VLIFSYFSVPPKYQHRVLFWGVLGALVFRGAMIGAGSMLIRQFEWIIYVFGAFLVFTGIKMARHQGGEVHPDRNPALRLVRRIVPMTSDFHGQRFFVKTGVKRFATPMLAVLIAVETTDVLFAVDSIPAIFAVTEEPFLVFTSNAFAILGLRALYFLLAGMMTRFIYLKVGLAAVLVLVGTKMLVADIYHVPVWASLLAIGAILATAVAASLRATKEVEVQST